jgi:proton-dependent oligopeptide transporter, POT family
MLGTWFLGAAVGNLFAGLIGGHVGSSDASALPGEFLRMVWIGAGAGIVMLLLAAPLRRWMALKD